MENLYAVLAGTSFCRTGNLVYDLCWAQYSFLQERDLSLFT